MFKKPFLYIVLLLAVVTLVFVTVAFEVEINVIFKPVDSYVTMDEVKSGVNVNCDGWAAWFSVGNGPEIGYDAGVWDDNPIPASIPKHRKMLDDGQWITIPSLIATRPEICQ